ncbi:MAG: amidohydrolase family protein [Proteobacteria bacterium]|nr:amidohydrolase family protein [Pseudomonadota bacterium]MBU1059414.1 amidohydrolase family protein [Pseudomonadota bacterium]
MNKRRYIKVGWLVDGSGRAIQEQMLLTVKNGVFTDIDRYEEPNGLDPAIVTDLSLCTILPPFVDCHVHLCMSGTTDQDARKQQLTADYAAIRPRIAEHLHDHFSHGVLAIRDGGDRQGHALRYKNETVAARKEPLILQVAGRAWHKKGRYGALIGRYCQNNESLSSAFSRENDSIDHVKLVNSGLNSLRVFGHQTSPQFSADEIRELIIQAHLRGKKVMVHANGQLPVRLALEAGCDSIEHGFFMGRDNLKLMAEMKTTWVPTAFTMKSYADTLEPHDTQIERSVVEKNLQHQLKQISLARDFGVPIALGTDAGSKGVLHGESVGEELKLLMKAGCSMPEAVRCATCNGAKLLGIEEIGLIAKGKPANFLVIRATPAMLPEKFSFLEAIYLDGRPYNME